MDRGDKLKELLTSNEKEIYDMLADGRAGLDDIREAIEYSKAMSESYMRAYEKSVEKQTPAWLVKIMYHEAELQREMMERIFEEVKKHGTNGGMFE